MKESNLLYVISHKSDDKEFSITRLAFVIAFLILLAMHIIEMIPPKKGMPNIAFFSKDFLQFSERTFGIVVVAYMTTKIKDAVKNIAQAIKDRKIKNENKRH